MEDEKSKRGFASMDREKQKALSVKGGESVRPEHRSFSKDPELAARAGRAGAAARDARRKEAKAKADAAAGVDTPKA